MTARIPLAARLALAFVVSASLALAQNPNRGGGPGGGGPGGPGGPGGRGPGGGGPGGGGPGGPGGWGGPGGPGGQNGAGGSRSSVTTLVQAEPVQEELKLNEKQKAQIKALVESATKKRTTVREQAQKVAEAASKAAQAEAAAERQANGLPPDNGQNAQNGGRGGRGNRGGNNADPAIGRAVRETMDNLQNEIDAAFMKVLDKKQQTRVKQIGAQVEGIGLFLQPETISKLVLEDEQVANIRGIMGDSRQARQEIGQKMRDALGELSAKNAASKPAAAAGNGDEEAPAPAPAPKAAANGNGNGNNNGNNGGRGGRNGNNNGGPGGRPNFDPTLFATPEFQALAEKSDQSRKQVESQAMQRVLTKVLSKPQRGAYSRMVGEPFDIAQLDRNARDRFRAQGGPGAQASAAPAPGATPAASASAPAPAAAKAATAPARKSLRELRGGGGSNPQ